MEAIWDYRYSWEIYTPQDKRKYGYYVLPMLWGQELAGRIEAAADRRAGQLTVKHIWFEEGVRPTKKLAAAIDRAVGEYDRYNNDAQICNGYMDEWKAWFRRGHRPKNNSRAGWNLF